MSEAATLPGLDLPVRAAYSRKGRKTREKGRRYARNRVCPKCFFPFTRKGITRHVRACRKDKTLTKPAARA